MKILCLLALVAVAYANDKIVGGTSVTSKTAYPWQVSLQISGGHFCGGSIISRDYVITAAHCYYQPAIVTVVMGIIDLTDSSGTAIKAATFTQNPDYSNRGYANDLAIIQLSQPAPLASANIEAIAYSTSANDYVLGNTEVTTTGWGYINGVTHQQTNILQEAQLPLLTDLACKGYWQNTYESETMICAGAAGQSSCMGDSGGPLVIYDANPPLLIGAVSWGSSTCKTNTPGVYAEINTMLEFIDAETN